MVVLDIKPTCIGNSQSLHIHTEKFTIKHFLGIKRPSYRIIPYDIRISAYLSKEEFEEILFEINNYNTIKYPYLNIVIFVLMILGLILCFLSLIDKNNIFCYVAVGLFTPILPIVFCSNKLTSEYLKNIRLAVVLFNKKYNIRGLHFVEAKRKKQVRCYPRTGAIFIILPKEENHLDMNIPSNK
ncbi:hypothetical protein PPL_00041 [Heterostelium album PN500]|uniref:Uncharacterized protein n=1 Tax=Heterostelium pallidum (strain ATCC 26659 / Pp 5 / PN500) TaxID=670386 RepID=D3BVP0_HETP5|nr:hypothetical protein PPL_00041 [Heterostelium album PN500]EFA74543.1 hypothetical protein PPL_00041 [Heterostelium album PN500]|eukprot:XP_020426677.1 hypothetical protein PPL_00041 [Heterostelium album PN500]